MADNRDGLNALAGLAPPTSRARFWPELSKLQRPEYLVKGIFDRGCFGEIYGPSGSGKSFLATDMGLHIAAGRQWCGRRVKQAAVLYVSAEGGTAIINRLEAWARHHDQLLDNMPFAVVTAPTNLLSEEGAAQILADAEGVPDLGLIIVDTAARVMPGGKEDAQDMGQFVSACDLIRAKTGAAIVVVHHSGKDTSRGSRGSTVLPAAVDAQIEVSPDSVSKISAADLRKSRDGATGELMTFRLEVVELGQDEDGDPITSCIIEAADAGRRQTKLTPRQSRALDVLLNLLVDHGKPAPEQAHYPPACRVVSVDLWRDYLTKAGVIDKEAKNPRTDFKRIRDGLIEKGAAGEWNDLIWAVTAT